MAFVKESLTLQQVIHQRILNPCDGISIVLRKITMVPEWVYFTKYGQIFVQVHSYNSFFFYPFVIISMLWSLYMNKLLLKSKEDFLDIMQCLFTHNKTLRGFLWMQPTTHCPTGHYLRCIVI